VSTFNVVCEFLFSPKSHPLIRTESGNTLTSHLNRNLCHSVIIVVKSQAYLAFWHKMRTE
jgi:hypothetical protein